MVIQIKVVVRIPGKDKEKFQLFIEAVTAVVRAVFPELQAVRYASAVTVTVDEFKEKIDEPDSDNIGG